MNSDGLIHYRMTQNGCNKQCTWSKNAPIAAEIHWPRNGSSKRRIETEERKKTDGVMLLDGDNEESHGSHGSSDSSTQSHSVQRENRLHDSGIENNLLPRAWKRTCIGYGILVDPANKLTPHEGLLLWRNGWNSTIICSPPSKSGWTYIPDEWFPLTTKQSWHSMVHGFH